MTGTGANNKGEALPVLVGVGQELQREADPRQGVEPLELMVAALTTAGRDSGAPGLLKDADSIYVLRGAWGYGDPGREIARRFGADASETVGTPYGGNFSQACVIDAARRIQAGQIEVALVAGAENGRSQRRAASQGHTLRSSKAPGAPDRMLAQDKAIFHEAELARGMNSATDIYAIFESAIRYARGEALDAHARRLARLWADFSAVAAENPHAWISKVYSPSEIGEASAENPMIAHPYTRLMNANARVDMGAGLIVCAEATALNAGVPREKLIYVHAATEANDPNFASNRADFHRSPGMRIAGSRVLELVGKRVEEVDHFDLYSCFPSAVQIAARELGIPEGRSLTVTGGLTFGGGPLNSYVLHAIARMAEVLRAAPGSTGLVSANGGWLAKHAFGIYSSQPPTSGFQYENLQAQVDRLPGREARVDWTGPVTVEAYTVACRRGEPHRALVACLTGDGHRTWGTVQDPVVLDAMTREEFCGRSGSLDGEGCFTLGSLASSGG